LPTTDHPLKFDLLLTGSHYWDSLKIGNQLSTRIVMWQLFWWIFRKLLIVCHMTFFSVNWLLMKNIIIYVLSERAMDVGPQYLFSLITMMSLFCLFIICFQIFLWVSSLWHKLLGHFVGKLIFEIQNFQRRDFYFVGITF
jgi:hypothetical protein